MKFTEHLSSHLTPEWRNQYIKYEILKEYLYKYIDNKPQKLDRVESYLDSCDEEFFEFCNEELEKINNFFSEKISEAKRKMESLNDDLMALHSHLTRKGKITRNLMGTFSVWNLDQDEEKRKRLIWSSNLKRKYRTHHDLKLAYSEFYLSLILLQNYQSLNFTGFRKILKKHDKLFCRSSGLQWRLKNVESSIFNTNVEVDHVITKVEDIYTNKLEAGDRQKAMKRLRVPPLAGKGSLTVSFRLGLFIGIFLMMVFVIGALLIYRYKYIPQLCIPAVRLFRSTFLILFFIFLIGFDMYCWRKAGVNHVLIFEIDPRNHVLPFELMEIAFGLLVIWGISVLYFLLSPVMGTPAYLGPFLIVLLLLMFFFNPVPIFYYYGRMWTCKVLSKILTAPMNSVKFADFWMADQLASLSFIFVDIGYFACFYGREINYQNGFRTNADILPFSTNDYILTPDTINYNNTIIHNNVCNTKWYGIGPILQMLPYWFRFAQCLRRYYDNYSDTRRLFPHIINAGKYMSSIMVVIVSAVYSTYYESWSFSLLIIIELITTIYTSAWDILMDWGLMNNNNCSRNSDNNFLRDELVYSHRSYYYMAIVEDLLSRLKWIVLLCVQKYYTNTILKETVLTATMISEVIRRCIWNLFRLENEHLNNCGEFRAVRDIFVAPIKKVKVDDSFQSLKKNTSDDKLNKHSNLMMV